MMKSLLASSLLLASSMAQTVDVSSLASQLSGDPSTFTLFSTTSYLSGTSISMLSNATHSLVSYNMSSSLTSKFGWIGLGFDGSTMVSAQQIVMAWPDPSSPGNWVLSNRKATAHAVPGVITTNPPTLLSSSSSAPNTLNYLIENKASASAQFIYAFSSNTVKSSDPTTTALVQHDNFGSFGADLTSSAGLDVNGQVNQNAPPVTGSSSKKVSVPLSRFDQLIILHAIMAGMAWMVISPTAVLMGRLGRHLGKTWFKIHWMFQVLLTSVLTIAAIILAIAAVNINGGFTASYHTVMGFVVFFLMLCQMGLGQYIHKKLDSNRIKRPIRNISHICLGLTISLLAYIQVHSGLKLYSTFRHIPSYLYTLYYILAFAPLAIYLMSLIALAVSRKKEGMTWGMAAFGLGRVGGFEIPGGSNKQQPHDLETGSVRSEDREKLVYPQNAYFNQSQISAQSFNQLQMNRGEYNHPFVNAKFSNVRASQGYLPRIENQFV